MSEKSNDGDVSFTLPIATDADSRSIKAIDKTTVHRICSGQVVLSLGTAVKELVENSIDAEASSIDVRLKDYGSTLIEVLDNGKGVDPSDFVGLTQKHCTSKLQDFKDLVEVKTFGFRGEALSSLCALGSLTITTRHRSQQLGTKLVFDNKGHIVEETPLARQVGTTVAIHNLFQTLPVRHKQFLKNIKKEFSKMVHVLHSYCLISTNIRIVCYNQVGKNSRNVVVSTELQSSVKDNISSIFGHKQIENLLEIKLKMPGEDALLNFGINESSSDWFLLEGFISSCEHSKGRSAPDRQFYYINGRPCDPSKISRLVNEVYHQYNRHQYPIVVLNIKTKQDEVDINVTPDKRQIMVNREQVLMAIVKSSLEELYATIPSTYQKNLSFSCINQSPAGGIPSKMKASTAPSLTELFSSRKSKIDASETPKAPDRSSDHHAVLGSLGNRKRPSDADKPAKYLKVQNTSPESSVLQNNLNKMDRPDKSSDRIPNKAPVISEALSLDTEKENVMGQIPDHASTQSTETSHIYSNNSSPNTNSLSKINKANNSLTTAIHSKTDDFLKKLYARKSSMSPVLKPSNSKTPQSPLSTFISSTFEMKNNENKSIFSNKSPEKEKSPADSDDIVVEVSSSEQTHHPRPSSSSSWTRRKSINLPFDFDLARKRLIKSESTATARKMKRTFCVGISPDENQAAENELKREIKMDSFKKMEILGQFNLGFIIVRLESDLFIIDQHATDEKYNYETLQKSFVLQTQRLIIPQTLELTPANELTLLDNIDIVKKSGFEFNVDNDRPVGRKVSLTAMPYSKGWEFTKDDVEEMIFTLSESPGVFCRPRRLNAMFASRACRTSVMIGTSLSRQKMRNLVNHMSEIDHPWNCPHGRPTMRHLIDLHILADVWHL